MNVGGQGKSKNIILKKDVTSEIFYDIHKIDNH